MDGLMARKRKSDDAEASGLDPIVKEAKDRFARCEETESEFRKLFVEDITSSTTLMLRSPTTRPPSLLYRPDWATGA
jgi:hypothetical protein